MQHYHKKGYCLLDTNIWALLAALSQAFQTDALLTPLANGLHLSPEHLDLAVHVEEDITFLCYEDHAAFSLMVHWMATCEEEDAVKLVYLHEAFAHCSQLQFCNNMVHIGPHLYCHPYGEISDDVSSNLSSENDDDDYSTHTPKQDVPTPRENGGECGF